MATSSSQLGSDHLVDGPGLLAAIFEKKNRPSLRWLRYQTKTRTIPYYRIGRLIRFDPARVREALAKNCLVNAHGGTP